ncbi:hypothetical protein LzC2_26550 [Planctomycetes bacterium LzC2]|uniref:Uncharacterized protein n=1 Tax=Alienimonas chondri TaxID=2681879 RepID=A0ABX1VID3_9PLAN|nr:hypothetical protein [Alienimonas chondri]
MSPSTLVTSVEPPDSLTPWLSKAPAPPAPSIVIVAASAPVPVEAIVPMPDAKTPTLLELVPVPWPVMSMAPATLVTSVVGPNRYTPWLKLVPAPPVPSMVIVAASAPVPVEEIVAMSSAKTP